MVVFCLADRGSRYGWRGFDNAAFRAGGQRERCPKLSDYASS